MKTTHTKLILGAALFFVLFDNLAFFQHVLAIYPFTLKNGAFLVSLTMGFTAFIILFFTLVSSRYTIKPFLILLLMLSSAASYFMNNYNVIFDDTMIQNILQTNLHESVDLISAQLLSSLLLLGVVPSLLVYKVQLQPVTLRKAAFIKVRDGLCTLFIIFVLILVFSKFYASFFREHKSLRYYTNPTYYIYSLGKYAGQTFNSAKVEVRPLGEDARPATASGTGKRRIVIVVVGEAARADHFSINGYDRETNPLLKKEDVLSYSNMYSCGTSTAYSVPCMFSVLPRKEYSDRKGMATENLLDVLQHAGVHVLWRDNNSSSKGVAKRIQYQDYKDPAQNPICDDECRDEGMLVGLQEYIDGTTEGDIAIILHQMGNHGPAYYKRYPASFKTFSPVCETNQFDECTVEEINNAYDNALLYTDYFLSQTIELLKKNSQEYKTAMIYMSDHGESLGEYGVYLHGLPYSMAPEVQKHIAALFWFGDSFQIDRRTLKENAANSYSHDNLFHTVLGLLDIQTAVYDASLDIIPHEAELQQAQSLMGN